MSFRRIVLATIFASLTAGGLGLQTPAQNPAQSLTETREQTDSFSQKREMDRLIGRIIYGDDKFVLPFRGTTADELKRHAAQVVELVLSDDIEEEMLLKTELVNGDVAVLSYTAKDATIVFITVEKSGDLFRLINLDGEPVDTIDKSFQSILTHYAKANGLSIISPKFHLGYPISPEVAEQLKERNVPTDCFCRWYKTRDGIRDLLTALYTELKLTGNLGLMHKLKFDEDRNIAYHAEQFEFLWPGHYLLVWKDSEQTWQNIVLKLEQNRFVEASTSKDLSPEWKCTIHDLSGIFKTSYSSYFYSWQGDDVTRPDRIILSEVRYSESGTFLKGYHSIYITKDGCFTNLPSDCSLYVQTRRSKTQFKLDISPTREIAWSKCNPTEQGSIA